MFGHRYYGTRFYGPRYFGDGGTGVPVQPVIPRGRGGRIPEELVERDPWGEREREDAAEREREASIDRGMLERIGGRDAGTQRGPDAPTGQPEQTHAGIADAARAAAGESPAIRHPEALQEARPPSIDEAIERQKEQRRRKIARQNAFIILSS